MRRRSAESVGLPTVSGRRQFEPAINREARYVLAAADVATVLRSDAGRSGRIWAFSDFGSEYVVLVATMGPTSGRAGIGAYSKLGPPNRSRGNMAGPSVRAIFAIPLGVLLAVVVVFALGRRPTWLVLSAPRGGTSSESLSPLPPPPGQAQQGPSSTPAVPGLACIQDALGGVQVFAGVSSLRIVGSTKVTATTGMRPLPNKREIGVVFPDRYKQTNVEKDPAPGHVPLASLAGFNGNELLSGLMTPRPPDDAVPKWMHGVRLGFVREMLMRLPRELADVRLSQRTTIDAGQERLAIEASGLDDLDTTLLADPRTCMPVAVQYTGASPTGPDPYRVDLSEYRRFGGILFPTVLKTTKNGEPWVEEYDSEIQVNAPLSDEYFRSSGR